MGGMAMTMDTVMALLVATVTMIMITGIPNPIPGAIIIDQVMDRDLIIGGEIVGQE